MQFRNERQGEDTLDQFYERLLKAATKAYPDIIDESQMDANLCDQLIFGLKDTGIKQKLLEMPPANSREALATAKRLLAAKRYSSTTQKILRTPKSCLLLIMYIHVAREVKDEAIGLARMTVNQYVSDVGDCLLYIHSNDTQ